MESVCGRSGAMPFPALVPEWHMPKWMASIDWKETGALLGVLGTLAVVLRFLFKPLWERVIYSALRDRCDRYDKAAEKVDANADKIEAIEAMVIAQGTVLRDMPRLIGSVESLSVSVDNLGKSIETMKPDLQEVREFKRYVEGVWDGQERRKGGRRADDQR